MKISVVTVCFNAKETIEETFISIFNQTYKNIESIVIDGASTDGTIDVIKRYEDQIAHFISETDEGIYDAMNKAIKLATGDFIIFLNANDVFYDSNVVEKVVNTLIANPDAKILFGNSHFVFEDKLNYQIHTYEKIKNDYSIIFNNICHQSIFYHHSLFDEFGNYSNEFKIYADWDFNIRCLFLNKVFAIYLPIIISKFQLGGICSNSESKEICKKERKLLLKKYNFNGLLYSKLLEKLLKFKNIAKIFYFQKQYQLNIKRVCVPRDNTMEV